MATKPKKTEYAVTLYIADVWLNNMMRGFDLRPEGKWYVKVVDFVFTMTKPLTEKRVREVMKRANDDKYKVVAVKCCLGLIVEPSVKQISDGTTVFFTGQ